MATKNLPLISIVIPTLNEERNIKICLDSLLGQKHPQSKLEIIVVDNRSTDKTIEIVKSYRKKYKNVKLIFNDKEKKNAEVSKMLGFQMARGEYFIYLDADIEIIGKDWFTDLLLPFYENSQLAGSFGRFWPKKDDKPLGRYLRYHPLELDPVFKFFCTEISETVIMDKKQYQICKFVPPRIPPVGICLYKKEYLDKVLKGESKFMDVDVPVKLAKAGYKYFAYVEKVRFYHKNVIGLSGLVRKKFRNIDKFYLPNIEKREFKYFNLKRSSDVLKIVVWVVYANLFVPELIRGVYLSFKNKDFACLYQPFASLLLTDAIIWGFLKSARGRRFMIQG